MYELYGPGSGPGQSAHMAISRHEAADYYYRSLEVDPPPPTGQTAIGRS